MRTNDVRIIRQSATALQAPESQNSAKKVSFNAQSSGYWSPRPRRFSNAVCSLSVITAALWFGATSGMSLGSSGRKYPRCISGLTHVNVTLLRIPAWASRLTVCCAGTGVIVCHRSGLSCRGFRHQLAFGVICSPSGRESFSTLMGKASPEDRGDWARGGAMLISLVNGCRMGGGEGPTPDASCGASVRLFFD